MSAGQQDIAVPKWDTHEQPERQSGLRPLLEGKPLLADALFIALVVMNSQ